MDADKPEKPWWKKKWWWAVAFGPSLYATAGGPVAYGEARSWLPPGTFRTVYRPLTAALDAGPRENFAQQRFDDYLRYSLSRARRDGGTVAVRLRPDPFSASD